MVVGIETGGTKLQVAVAPLDRPEEIQETIRTEIDRAEGAAGILRQVESSLNALVKRYCCQAIGFGFGGPVSVERGCAITSHQVDGWDNYPLTEWCQERWPVPVRIGNDCNVAALAEAKLGAGRGSNRVMYVTVGTGVGGGFVIDGSIDGELQPAAAEVGHLRPGLDCLKSSATVESMASGLGIECTAAQAIANSSSLSTDPQEAAEFGAAVGTPTPTAQQVFQASDHGDPLAQRIVERAATALGWALAQATTLLAPDRIVLGGGVALGGGPVFLGKITSHWQQFCFPPLRSECDLVTSSLGEAVVLNGAMLLAVEAFNTTPNSARSQRPRR